MSEEIPELQPHAIVAELDKHIVGQLRAKKLVALALRNRWRRMRLADDIAREVLPKHILMIGPTGCGKTEIARRLARLAQAPFIKVEATKFTEVGYVGRDVDSIVRDLVTASVNLVRDEEMLKHTEVAKDYARTRLIEVLTGKNASPETVKTYGQMLDNKEIESKELEIELKEPKNNFSMELPGAAAGIVDLGEMLGQGMGVDRRRKRKVSVAEAREELIKEEQEKRIDSNQVSRLAIKRVEERGIVFLDEIDKVLEFSDSGSHKGGVSREGVQRDLLPLIEGSNVQTKHGMVDTSHILFIAAGAFHLAKPNDLIPELQGRLPVRVELDALTEADLLRVLQEPRHSLVVQYQALLAVEGLEVSFAASALKRIAALAYSLNQQQGNVGARRLFTVMEHLVEDLSFAAHEMRGKKVVIDEKMVDEKLEKVAQSSQQGLAIL